MLTIAQAESESQLNDARTLFREYEVWLGIDLCFQNFEAEMAGLPGKYAQPEGRLFIAHIGKKLCGCIALRKLDDGICEMKRLFVRDHFRGQKAGIQLIDKLITDAREIGYKKLRLDTCPLKMEKAVSLYESYGFHPIKPYYDNPHDGVIFMETAL